MTEDKDKHDELIKPLTRLPEGAFEAFEARMQRQIIKQFIAPREWYRHG